MSDAELRVPQDDLVMIVDRSNVAHVLLPRDDRPIFTPTICGHRMDDLAGIPHDVQDVLAAEWGLLTNPQYRAWPPWPCQGCMGIVEQAA